MRYSDRSEAWSAESNATRWTASGTVGEGRIVEATFEERMEIPEQRSFWRVKLKDIPVDRDEQEKTDLAPGRRGIKTHREHRIEGIGLEKRVLVDPHPHAPSLEVEIRSSHGATLIPDRSGYGQLKGQVSPDREIMTRSTYSWHAGSWGEVPVKYQVPPSHLSCQDPHDRQP